MIVLIAENDVEEVLKLSACIRSSGHTPISVDNIKSIFQLIKKETPGLILMSMQFPSAQIVRFFDTYQAFELQPPVIVTSRKAGMDDAVTMMKAGAYDFWVRPVAVDRLSKTLELLEEKYETAKSPRESMTTCSSIISNNPAMLRLKSMAKKVAASSASVFLQGESGTGKELFARYIHSNSERRNKIFVALNCGALPETLIDSELFGHEKGAFTGAIKNKEGKFELAHEGTLFLDEVTEIPVHLQSKLLRVLQEGEVDRVGGKYPVSVDVRVVASTNVAMEETLRAGQFRKDLYYRLNVIPIKIPPLRERREDIPLLCSYFMDKYNSLHKCSVEGMDEEALKTLQSYSWPGNVRELENVMQRAILLTHDRRLSREHLIFDNECETATAEIGLMSIGDMERLLIQKALSAVNGNRTHAADILGISVRTLRNKLHEYKDLEGAA
ncbi:MAG: sigma-54 dependent transcriptional regulator [Syntrophobacteraceae bacterium]